jgi:hypothetical protein
MRHDIILMAGKSSPKLIPKGIELLWQNADFAPRQQDDTD